ncbi:DUF2147 domain-containing protein [Deminuibacter soli]|uniref:DUF2147 domain-containing protein n=1 Tax=Deminuibacter soli TaxID=2291815 RepID=A0A3E1NCX6_9BACT|nr:DUF2147 domain-containing protein [Deminuibacter soli]RFM25691.1 DUF2147 domain-containing protein [Deminuibacter soli]
MKNYLLAALLCLCTLAAFAQKEPIEKTWFNEEKTAKIEVYKAVDGKLYGKLVWMQDATDANGKPRTDSKNPNESLRNTPLMNYPILKGFTKGKTEGVYEGGTVYDPKTGKTYCGKLTLQAGGNELKLKGYICSFSMLGRTSVWTVAP